jgi:hypothetical protein
VNCFGGPDFLATNAVLAAGGVSAWVGRLRRGRIVRPVSDDEVAAFMARLRQPGQEPATIAAPADR